MQETRQNRIARLLQKELATIFQQQTRQTHGVLVSVTRVRISPDLSICTAYLSIFPSEKAEDLLKNGLIPEFIGRLPVVVTLDALDEAALVSILTQPKNALVKQYRKLLEMDGVKLSFEEEALQLIAKEALKRKTGARGLRSILEKIMRNVMYDVPSAEDVTSCLVTKETITEKKDPVLTVEKKKAKKVMSSSEVSA